LGGQIGDDYRILRIRLLRRPIHEFFDLFGVGGVDTDNRPLSSQEVVLEGVTVVPGRLESEQDLATPTLNTGYLGTTYELLKSLAVVGERKRFYDVPSG
jgi:hypothetical protein